MSGYMHSTMTFESSKVVLDLEDPEFVSFKFYNDSRCIAHIHVLQRDYKSLKLMDGELQFGKEYTLMEEAVVTDTVESA